MKPNKYDLGSYGTTSNKNSIKNKNPKYRIDVIKSLGRNSLKMRPVNTPNIPVRTLFVILLVTLIKDNNANTEIKIKYTGYLNL